MSDVAPTNDSSPGSMASEQLNAITRDQDVVARGLAELEAMVGIKGVAKLGRAAPETIDGAAQVKGNKFSAAGAAAKLPPPTTPIFKIHVDTPANYHALMSNVNQAFGIMAAQAKPHDLTALTPKLKAGLNAQQKTAYVDAAASAVQSTLHSIFADLGAMGMGSSVTAFACIREQSMKGALSTEDQINNLATALRKEALDQQTMENKKANQTLQKALAKQQKLGVLGKILTAVLNVLTIVFSIALAPAGLGVALAAAATVLGFVAGGAVAGKHNGTGFSLTGALDGAAMGALVLPMAALIRAALRALEKGIAAVISRVGVQSTKAAEKSAIEKALTGNVKKIDDAIERFDISIENFAKQVTKEFEKHFGPALKDEINGAMERVSKAKESMGLKDGSFWGSKTENIITTALPIAQSGATVAQSAYSYSLTKLNVEAGEDLNWGKMCEISGKMAQTMFEDSQTILQSLQKYHKDGLEQALGMMQSHFQAVFRMMRPV